jgi:hypothetical protein
MTHDSIGRFVMKMFADIQTIFCMEEHPERVGGAQKAVGKGLQHAERQEREDRQLLRGPALGRRE